MLAHRQNIIADRSYKNVLNRFVDEQRYISIEPLSALTWHMCSETHHRLLSHAMILVISPVTGLDASRLYASHIDPL